MGRRNTFFSRRKHRVHHSFAKDEKKVVADLAHLCSPKDLLPCVQKGSGECDECDVRLHQEKLKNEEKKKKKKR